VPLRIDVSAKTMGTSDRIAGVEMMPEKGSSSPTVRERSGDRLHLRLYVTGDSPGSVLARHNVQRFCEEFGCGDETTIEVEVIDILKATQFMSRDGVLVAPALVKVSPKPSRLILGDLNQKALVANVFGLGYPPHQRGHLSEAPCASMRSILLVEDDGNDIYLAERSFEKAGIAVRIDAVTDGEEAIHYLARSLGRNVLPNLVILDLKLPKLNGLEVLKWIRGRPELAQLPVVMLTSSWEASDIGRATELGASAYALKPGNFSDLTRLAAAIAEAWLPEAAADGAIPRGSD
jgi:two-component system, chemotaxis family, response regulator Rcp1